MRRVAKLTVSLAAFVLTALSSVAAFAQGAAPAAADTSKGYIAIGAARGRGTYIGHFCTSVMNWRESSSAVFAKMKEEFRAAGFGEFPGGTGVAGTFKDPDGIEIQFLPSPDTLVTAAVPSDLVPSQQGLVVPQRVDSVLVRVSNLDKALQFYRTLYGKEASRNAGSAQFNFRNGSRLMLEQVSYVYDGGGPVRIARYGVLVKPFDRAAVAAAIPQLGGKVVKDDGKVLRLTDADRIELELATAAP